jgi:hypothetical protein
MAIQELTKAEIQLLEELTAAGERGRTIARPVPKSRIW